MDGGRGEGGMGREAYQDPLILQKVTVKEGFIQIPLVFSPFCGFVAKERGLQYSFRPVAAILVFLSFELVLRIATAKC